MVVVNSASKQVRSSHQPLEARSRRELFRHTSAVVFELAPAWDVDGAAIVVTHHPLTRADVQRAFDEISQKHHVEGIALRFEEHAGEPLHATFESVETHSVSRDLPVCESRWRLGGVDPDDTGEGLRD
jgi:hypothetical protein